MMVAECITRKRKYQLIWECAVRKAIDGNSSPVVVKIDGLTNEVFKRIRKAFWKERDLDEVNKKFWWCHVERKIDQPNLILFSAVPPTPPWKDRI